MNATRPVLAMLVSACLFLPPAARAQEVKPEDRNAALRYATIAYSTDRDLFAKTFEVDMSKVGFDPAAVPENFKAACDALKSDGNDAVASLIEASRLRKCDFEVAWEQGVAAILPHLGKLRADARLLRVDARRLEIAGDADAAAERIAAMIRIARHATFDDIVISSLVGAAICLSAIDETEAALAASKLTPAAQQKILAALNSLDQDDPFAMKPAIRGEQRWTLGWIKADFRGPDAGKKLVATGYLEMGVLAVMPPSPPPPAAGAGAPAVPAPPAPPSRPPGDAPVPQPSATHEAVESIGRMNESQLHAAADLASPYYDKVIAVWNKPDAVEQLTGLVARIETGEFGPIGRIFAPAAPKAREMSLKGEKRIDEIKQKLAGTR